MPRDKRLRNDMSKGWRSIRDAWELELDNKIERAHALLAKALSEHTHPVVCWSGGKDSTVVLHLVLQHFPDIPVVNVDTGVEFPDTIAFVKHLASCWSLNLILATPEDGVTFWSIGEKHGWPIFGKNIAQNVEYANRSGNLREQLSVLEQRLAEHKVHISNRCTQYLQTKPSKKAEAECGADLKVVGLRAQESMARARLYVDHGDYYMVKRYYGRGKPIWKVNPIALWTERDVWAYHEQHEIPHCALYDKGYERNGCWPCAMAVRYGQLRRLRLAYPELHRFLVTESKMAPVLLRAKCVAEKTEESVVAPAGSPQQLIDEHPTFFDTIKFVR